ncbi:MAG TPA: hypothetical protein VHB99_06340 [Pirellulales bacterium]|nr:hypothetical protein [Pirellulales bacterium]
MAAFAGVLVLAIATPLLRPTLAIAGAVGVFDLLARLAAKRRIDDEDEETLGCLLGQEGLPQHRIEIEPTEARTPQHPTNLRPAPRFRANASGCLQTRHPAAMQDKGNDHLCDRSKRRLAQPNSTQEPLEPWHQIGDHDHGEAPSSAGEMSMIWSL